MKAEELAFVNQQLAAMLRNGIPLEGALRQLCTDMRRSPLRDELQKLQADLANGVPFEQAVTARRLPAFYIQMLRVGAKSNDLPGVLTLVADYYERVQLLQLRLKGLMVYPAIVLVGTLLLSTWLTYLMGNMRTGIFADLLEGCEVATPAFLALVWTPPVLLAIVTAGIICVLAVPALRQWMRWRLPATREANLAQVAAALASMVKSGCTLADGISLLQQLEVTSPAGREMAGWLCRLREGATSFLQIAGRGNVFPPLFVSLVANARDDVAQGFQQTAAVYEARAVHRSEMLMQAALPTAILTLGALLCTQMLVIVLVVSRVVSMLGE